MAAKPKKDPVKGTYQHFKGAFYEVLGIAEEPETGSRASPAPLSGKCPQRRLSHGWRTCRAIQVACSGNLTTQCQPRSTPVTVSPSTPIRSGKYHRGRFSLPPSTHGVRRLATHQQSRAAGTIPSR